MRAHQRIVKDSGRYFRDAVLVDINRDHDHEDVDPVIRNITRISYGLGEYNP